MNALPEAYKARMMALLGEDFPAYEAALAGESVRAFRVNTDKISLEEFAAVNTLSESPVPFVPTGFYLEAEHIGAHPFHHAGMIYVQEPAAMAPAECVPIRPDAWVLDLCAAPGGKSTQLKNKLGPDGVLVSNEIISSRCKILTGNVERLGLRNVVTTCLSPDRVAKIFPETFDVVTVDAPCSGEGMFRKEAAAIPEWSEENVALCARRQADILDAAAAALKPGGTILYATCTFSLEENEKTVDAFLTRHPEFVLLPVPENLRAATEDGIEFPGCRTENIRYTRRFYPHKGRGEGQFMAVLQSRAEPFGKKSPLAPIPKEKDKTVFAFLDDTLTHYDRDQVLSYNGRPVYFTPAFPVPPAVAFALGVSIGEVRKNYVQPHHQFFMAMGKDFRRKIDLSPDSDELRRYLHGEEIPANCDNGWAVVTVCGCAVGGAKVVDGRAKNHYPKGLRI